MYGWRSEAGDNALNLSADRHQSSATFRFYAELNDFLPANAAAGDRLYRFTGQPSVKDAFEAQGVPHPEVDLVLLNGESVGFDCPLRHGDRVSLYPVFQTFDVAPLLRVRERPLRPLRFICDVHLGKLARWLRLLGFDTAYRNDATDPQIAAQAEREQRAVLTRDVRLLQRRVVTHGYWIRSVVPREQIREIARRFRLDAQITPFSRCLECNGPIHPVPKHEVLDQLEPKTREVFSEFSRCDHCRRIYWRGSHYERMAHRLQAVLGPGVSPTIQYASRG